MLTWWVTSFVRWLKYHPCSFRWKCYTCSYWSCWTTSRLTSTCSPIRSQFSLRISTDTINFKLSEKEYVFVVLLQNDFKQVWVKMLILSCIVLICNYKVLHNFNSIERNRRYRSSQVAYRMVMVFIVSKRSSWKLYPSANEILFNSRLKFQHVSFLKDLFIWINFYFMDLVRFFFYRFLHLFQRWFLSSYIFLYL